jgi:small subunit ribosomal protein S6
LASNTQREYELVLMLDPEIPDERREQIASEARTRIESGGQLKHDTSWGMRKLAYEIRQRTEADYRFFRFETQGELLDDLNHNLRIADGVLRFRIFKVDPDSPSIVPPAPVASSASAPARGPRRPPGGGPPRDQPEPAAEEASEPAEQGAESGEQAPEPAPAAEAAGPSEPASQPPAPSEGDGEEPAASAAQASESETAE